MTIINHKFWQERAEQPEYVTIIMRYNNGLTILAPIVFTNNELMDRIEFRINRFLKNGTI